MSDGFAAAHAAMLRDRKLQFELKDFQAPQPPKWLEWLGDLLVAALPALNFLFWAGVVVMAALIVFFLVREVLGARAKGDKGKPLDLGPSQWRPDQRKARILLADADRLAGDGRYAEAAHLLLLKGVEDVHERWPRDVKPALTSREIADLPQLPARARTAFGAIAEVVERSLFGGREVGEAGWRDCRDSYEALVFAETSR